MATLTELALFKLCVESPKTFKLEDLNMDRIPGSTKGTNDVTSHILLQKKSLKLFHMVWSGVTKFMRSVCQV